MEKQLKKIEVYEAMIVNILSVINTDSPSGAAKPVTAQEKLDLIKGSLIVDVKN